MKRPPDRSSTVVAAIAMVGAERTKTLLIAVPSRMRLVRVAAAAIARSVGRRLMNEYGSRRAVVRCLRRMSQPRDLADLNPGFPPQDPEAAAYDVTLLTADVWIDDDGQTQFARRASRSELAPLRPESPRASPCGSSSGSWPPIWLPVRQSPTGERGGRNSRRLL